MESCNMCVYGECNDKYLVFYGKDDLLNIMKYLNA